MKKIRLDIAILKDIGLFCVILAHMEGVPNWLMQLRNFDVPLLCFVSGLLSKKSSSDITIIEYWKKRFIRLAVPTWIFLIIYFSVCTVIGYPPSIKSIIASFFFQYDGGIMGVWIVWIYLWCALLTPFLLKLKNVKLLHKIAGMVAVGIIYEFLYAVGIGSSNRLFVYCSYYIVAYGIVYMIGMIINEMNTPSILISLICFGCIWLGIAVYLYCTGGNYVLTSEYKYPPRIYYSSYAIMMIGILYILFVRKMGGGCTYRNTIFQKCIVKISMNSFWIYLWHIFYKCLLLPQINGNWMVQYVAVLACSFFTVWLQQMVFNYIDNISDGKYKKYTKIFRG